MRAGTLRHRLELQSATSAADSMGEMIQTFATYATVWGSLSPLSGRELEAGKQINAEIEHQAVIRYNSSVKPYHRIVAKSRTFDIVSILNTDERNKMQTLMLKEVV